MSVGWEILVQNEVPNFLAFLLSVERLKLRVAHAPELFVNTRRFSAVAVSHQLHYSFAVVDLALQHSAQIALFGSENILPNWLVTEKSQCVSD